MPALSRAACPSAGRRGARFGRRGGGSLSIPPANTVAPVISSDGSVIGIGETLTGTDGTWTGSPAPTFTYQWQVGSTFGLGGGSYSSIGGATTNARTLVAAQHGFSLRLAVTATNAAGSATAYSNALLYLHATDLPDTAIGMLTTNGAVADGITTAAGTVSQWLAKWGGKAANVILDAPAATNEPAWNATGGPGGTRGLVTFDGSDNVLRDTAVTAWGFSPGGFHLQVVGFLAGAETSGDIMLRYTGTDHIALVSQGTPIARGTTSGTGGATSSGTTTITATHRIMEYAGFGDASGTQSILINNGAAEDTDAITHGTWTDAGTLALGAASTAINPTALTCIGWSVTLVSGFAQALSAGQRANLRAFLQNGCGVA